MNNKNGLLTRKEFRDFSLKRDEYKCVICGEKATYDKDGEVNSSHHWKFEAIKKNELV